MLQGSALFYFPVDYKNPVLNVTGNLRGKNTRFSNDQVLEDMRF